MTTVIKISSFHTAENKIAEVATGKTTPVQSPNLELFQKSFHFGRLLWQFIPDGTNIIRHGQGSVLDGCLVDFDTRCLGIIR